MLHCTSQVMSKCVFPKKYPYSPLLNGNREMVVLSLMEKKNLT